MPTPSRPAIVEDVEAIAPGVFTEICDWEPYIAGANIIIDELAISSCGSSLTDVSLFEAERWLAAHLASQAVKTPSSLSGESILKGDIRVDYSVATIQPGIGGTSYGQTANIFAGGCLGLKGLAKTQVAYL